MVEPIPAAPECRRRRRAPLPTLPMALIDETAWRFITLCNMHGSRLDQPEPQMRAAIGHFLMVVAGPIRANSRGRREVYRSVKRIVERTERGVQGGTAPRASTPVGAPHTDD